MIPFELLNFPLSSSPLPMKSTATTHHLFPSLSGLTMPFPYLYVLMPKSNYLHEYFIYCSRKIELTKANWMKLFMFLFHLFFVLVEGNYAQMSWPSIFLFCFVIIYSVLDHVVLVDWYLILSKHFDFPLSLLTPLSKNS